MKMNKFFSILVFATLLAFGLAFLACSSGGSADEAEVYAPLRIEKKADNGKLLVIEISTTRTVPKAITLTPANGDSYVMWVDNVEVSRGTILVNGRNLTFISSDGKTFYASYDSANDSLNMPVIPGPGGNGDVTDFGTGKAGGSGGMSPGGAYRDTVKYEVIYYNNNFDDLDALYDALANDYKAGEKFNLILVLEKNLGAYLDISHWNFPPEKFVSVTVKHDKVKIASLTYGIKISRSDVTLDGLNMNVTANGNAVGGDHNHNLAVAVINSWEVGPSNTLVFNNDWQFKDYSDSSPYKGKGMFPGIIIENVIIKDCVITAGNSNKKWIGILVDKNTGVGSKRVKLIGNTVTLAIDALGACFWGNKGILEGNTFWSKNNTGAKPISFQFWRGITNDVEITEDNEFKTANDYYETDATGALIADIYFNWAQSWHADFPTLPGKETKPTATVYTGFGAAGGGYDNEAFDNTGLRQLVEALFKTGNNTVADTKPMISLGDLVDGYSDIPTELYGLANIDGTDLIIGSKFYDDNNSGWLLVCGCGDFDNACAKNTPPGDPPCCEACLAAWTCDDGAGGVLCHGDCECDCGCDA